MGFCLGLIIYLFFLPLASLLLIIYLAVAAVIVVITYPFLIIYTLFVIYSHFIKKKGVDQMSE